MTLSIGIDLGTTNSVLAFGDANQAITHFSCLQSVAPGETAKLEALPSSLYLPGHGEFGPDASALPWGDPGYFLGDFAVRHGAQIPGRCVNSAKSWLSYSGVDRGAAILPWGGADDVDKISPIEASTRILRHLRQAWDQAHPEHLLADQEIILTVPASFDEVARHLTSHAAVQAGLGQVRLLEEPQAALYDFLRAHQDQLLSTLATYRLILVIDVGGGTTDLSLVEVQQRDDGPPQLERLAVGDHLMLGGDNMDASLARYVEQQLTGSIGSLGAAAWGALVQSARLAKESLLSAEPPERFRVVLPGRGTKLVGSGQSHELERVQAMALLLDGFLPLSAPDQRPLQRWRSGLAEFGLPYAQDPAISHHIADFLRRHTATAAGTGARIYDGLPRPDAILLNGGVFNSAALRERLSALFAHWFDGDQVPLLQSQSLDLAVARGAAYYGLVRQGHGLRIGGGSARAYYIGVEDAQGQQQALCVSPKGMLEGQQHQLAHPFTLRLGQPVSFPLWTSTAARHDAPGDLREPDQDLQALPPLTAVLQAPQEVPVLLQAALSEVGTLELSLGMEPQALPHWALSFSTRQEVPKKAQADDDSGPIHKNLDQARDFIARYYGNKTKELAEGTVKALRRHLESSLGTRDTWSTALSRELFGALLVGAKRRRRSADHERVFYQLAGFCLRPGFGAPFDDWRVGELFKLFEQGVQYNKDKSLWAAWWILWRRVGGGLSAEQQVQIYAQVWPWLDANGPRPKGAKPQAEDEMLRLLASLERLPSQHKIELGTWVLRRLSKAALNSWWAMGKLGVRQPFYGSAHDVVPKAQAEEWLQRLLGVKWTEVEGAAFAALQMARRTGDRERDIDASLREKILRKMRQEQAPEAWQKAINEVCPMSHEDEASAFGDSLPPGLIWTGPSSDR